MELEDASDNVILEIIDRLIDGADLSPPPTVSLRRAIILGDEAIKDAKENGAPCLVVLSLSEWVNSAKTMVQASSDAEIFTLRTVLWNYWDAALAGVRVELNSSVWHRITSALGRRRDNEKRKE